MKLTRKRIWVLLLVVFAIFVSVAFLGSFYGPLLGKVGIEAHHYLNLPMFMLGSVPVTFIFLLKVIVFLVVLGLLASFSLRTLQRRVLTHTPLAAPQQYAVAKVGSYFVFAFGLIIGLESLGLNLNSLVVVGGALGLGVGLGLQPVVANFVAGLILLFEQPIRIGDRIQVGETYGDVVDIRGRSTWVRTNENIVIIVPNSDFITKELTNWTVNDRKVRVNVPVGVGYNSDPEQVRSLLLKIAGENDDVLSDPAPDVVFKDFGDSSLDFILRVWTTSKLQVPTVLTSTLNFAIFRAFTDAGIELPFPQRDLHLRSIDADLLRTLTASRGGAGDRPGDQAAGRPGQEAG